MASASALGASLMYGMMLEPLKTAFGEFGSVLITELANLPLRDARDPLYREFCTIFHEGDTDRE